VSVDGKVVGPSPVVRLPLKPGAHRLVLKRPGRTKVVMVSIRQGETTSVVVEMKPEPADDPKRPAFLSVACTPRCDSVTVNGKPAGPSPVVRYRVAAGRHRLELRSGRVTRPVTVLVDPGETKNLHISMHPPGREQLAE
jgi:hypothetical protein